jgi:hypothetical protein
MTQVPLELIQEYLAIQAHITNSAPDFEDGFSQANTSWYPVAEGVSAADLIEYDTLSLALKAGTPTEKIVLQAESMQATNFALEFDLGYGGWTGDTVLGVGFPSTGQDDETNFDFHLGLESQEWFIGLTDGTVESQGVLRESLRWQEPHLQIIHFNTLVGVFLNGEYLGHAEGIQHPGSEVWIYAVTRDEGRVGIDNVKFWNLDNLNLSK